MTNRARILSLVVLSASLLSPPSAEGQRTGLVIDLGMGPGLVSSSTTIVGLSGSERESKVGLMLKFNIGRVIGDSFALYLANQAILHGTARQGADRAITSITGVGVSYPLSADFSVRGVVGFGREALYMDTLFDTSVGLGLLAGGRYSLFDRWALDLDVMYTSWNDGAIFGSEEVDLWAAGLTFSWLSH